MKNRLFSILSLLLCGCFTLNAQEKDLRFDNSKFSEQTLVMYDGTQVKYRAYEGIFYVTNVEDSAYQTLNIYVPEQSIGKHKGIPVFLRTYVGGYMAAKAAPPSKDDATGRALLEGYVVCIPGTRGSNSVVRSKGVSIYTGRAPNTLLDLKAAVRYLKYNDEAIEGDANMIITDGTSAGGAMSSLLGATGNHPAFDKLLDAMGAAKATDDVFASVCYCPITDLDHADMAYEWLYSCTNDSIRDLSKELKQISEELSAQYPSYINSLKLTAPQDMRFVKKGDLITSANYMDYLKSWLILSFQKAKNEGIFLPDNMGIVLNEKKFPMMNAANGGRRNADARGNDSDNDGRNMRRGRGDFSGERPPMMGGGGDFGGGRPPMGRDNGFEQGGNANSNPRNNRRNSKDNPMFMQQNQGEFVIDIDMNKYLNYVASTQQLKNPPAFDSKGVTKNSAASAENNVFGDEYGNSANFTQYSIMKAQGNQTRSNDKVAQMVYLYNPMNFIGNKSATNAPNWYIRHGARDRDTGFQISINLATKLLNNGKNVDFALPYNRPHSGDYNLDYLFSWIKTIIK